MVSFLFIICTCPVLYIIINYQNVSVRSLWFVIHPAQIHTSDSRYSLTVPLRLLNLLYFRLIKKICKSWKSIALHFMQVPKPTPKITLFYNRLISPVISIVNTMKQLNVKKFYRYFDQSLFLEILSFCNK